MIKISCEEYAKDRKETLRVCLNSIPDRKKPYLLIFQTIDDAASNAYVIGKMNDAKEIGIKAKLYRDFSTVASYTNALIRMANRNRDVSGIIVQQPSFLTKNEINKISPIKDVDGLVPNSMHNPATAKGIMDWLAANKVDLCGKTVTIIGRSDLVGKPLAKLMTEANATVTLCHSMTKDIRKHTKGADIVVSAVGKPRWLTRSYFNNSKKQIVIDVGISRVNGKLMGDVDPKVAGKVAYLTPVPKGVGLLTRVALMENIVKAWRKRISEDR